jgi:hypothetical protein
MRALLTLTAIALLCRSARAEDPPPAKLARFFHPSDRLRDDLGKYRSPLRFNDGRVAMTAADWKRRRVEILSAWHALMGPWPEKIAKPRVRYLAKERRGTVTQHHVEVEVAAKASRKGYLLVPDGKGPFPAVLVVFYDPETGIGRKGKLRDFAWQLALRGFVTLSVGSPPESYYPDKETCKLQPLSFHAYVASTCRNALANLPEVDPKRIAVMGHSYGGKWAMFAACLDEQFACGVWSDPGVAFDEKRSNVNYWDPWYLGFEPGKSRKRGLPTKENPAIGPYKQLVERGHDLHELQALMAPRPFLVSGGSEDRPERWRALNHAVAVNRLLGYKYRVAMTNRKGHDPTEESNEQIYLFLEHFLKGR